MGGLFKKKSNASVRTREAFIQQPPGEIFPWPQGFLLTALDEVIIEIPQAIFCEHELIGSVVLTSPDAEFCIPPKDDDSFFIRLQPGMSISLTKSCEVRVVANDQRPRRFKITGPDFKKQRSRGDRK